MVGELRMMGRKAAVIVGLVAAILLSVSFHLSLNNYQSESDDRDTLFFAGDTQNPDRVDLVAYILTVDPERDEAKFRLTFYPKGNLTKDGLSSIWNLKLIAPDALCSGSRGFEKGTPLASVDLSAFSPDDSIPQPHRSRSKGCVHNSDRWRCPWLSYRGEAHHRLPRGR